MGFRAAAATVPACGKSAASELLRMQICPASGTGLIYPLSQREPLARGRKVRKIGASEFLREGCTRMRGRQ